MSGEASSQEKTEDATPRRKQQARKKGSVAKSQDLTSSLVVGALLFGLPPIVQNLGEAFVLAFKQGVSEMPTSLDFYSVAGFTSKVFLGPVTAFLPLVFLVMGVGVGANLAQVGFLLTAEPLSPKWEKLNPFSGIKKIFSRQAGVEGLKASVKTFVFGYIGYSSLQTEWDRVSSLAYQNATSGFGFTGYMIQNIATKVGVAWLALAALDYFFQRKQFEKNLRMSKQEVKQEFKESEQSPELKMAMARQRRRMRKGRPLASVKDADVIITNPTHYAVALKYKPGEMHAPQVVAKGVDFLAAKIREEAKLYKIPIVPSPPLARQLYKKCEIGDFVPGEMFQAVAEVLAFVYRTLRKT